MGATPMREFLQILCQDSLWNYAVFWKFQHQNQMLLRWEDMYCDCPKLRDLFEIISDDICIQKLDKFFYSHGQSTIHDDTVGEYSSGLAAANKSSDQFAFGKGIIGEVAHLANHCWLFRDDMLAGGSNFKLDPEFPEEWLFQFAVGIKTILLLPVVPHGVLQLGSLDMVAEDLALVFDIKKKFNAHQSFAGYPSKDFLAQSLYPVLTPKQNLPEPSTINKIGMTSEDLPSANYLNEVSCRDPEDVDNVQDTFSISEYDVPVSDNISSVTDFDTQLLGLPEVFQPLDQLLNVCKPEVMETNMSRVSGPSEELLAISYSDSYMVGEFGKSPMAFLNHCSDGGMLEYPFVENSDDTNYENITSLLSIPVDSELNQAVGPVVAEQSEVCMFDSSISGDKICCSSTLIGETDFSYGVGPTHLESSRQLGEVDDTEHLLQAAVTNLCNNLDDNYSVELGSVKSSMTTSRQNAASFNSGIQSEGCDLKGKNAVPSSCTTSASVARGSNVSVDTSLSASSFHSTMTTLIKKEQQQKGYSCLQPKRGSKLSNLRKKRAGSGNNPRPRPRDRQLIQDRVKELRELVPNGAKCSIDGLLERTIEHMLFLRSVTHHVDKFRQSHQQEVFGVENSKSSETVDNSGHGTTRAFELGSELDVCPIVVKDLETAGQMLIEIICDQNDFFLEIAEVICCLKLTILKGTLESRARNNWAYFIVEVPSGFHRLDVFWPLMQLLQQSRSPISTKS